MYSGILYLSKWSFSYCLFLTDFDFMISENVLARNREHKQAYFKI